MLCFSVGLMAQSVHSVKQGETLETIAKKYGTTASELKKLNPNADIVFVGLLLNVPQVKQKGTGSIAAKAGQKRDRIEMRDGSYVLCKVISIKQAVVTIEQEEIDGSTTLQVKDISMIEYANGKKRVFKK